MAKQWKNEDIIYPEDAQRWEDGLEDAKQNNSQNTTNLKNHTDNKSNPHNVTAAQTGAYTKAETDTKDSTVLSTAKAYMDSHSVKKDNPHGVTAGQTGAYTKTEADERDASTLSAARSYSDTKKTEATTYTDQKVAAAKSEIQSGSVASAHKLTTARKIAGIDFDGSKDISIPANNVGAYTKAEADSKVATAKTEIQSGNVASATKLQNTRTINGVSFDGTSNITIAAGNVGAYTKAEVDSKLEEVADPSWIDVSQYLTSSFKVYNSSANSKVVIQRINKTSLLIAGVVSPTKTLTFTSNDQEYDLISVPKSILGITNNWSFAPAVEQASGTQIWLLGMSSDTNNLIFKMSRHRYGTTWTNCNAGDWLPFNGIVRLVL